MQTQILPVRGTRSPFPNSGRWFRLFHCRFHSYNGHWNTGKSISSHAESISAWYFWIGRAWWLLIVPVRPAGVIQLTFKNMRAIFPAQVRPFFASRPALAWLPFLHDSYRPSMVVARRMLAVLRRTQTIPSFLVRTSSYDVHRYIKLITQARQFFTFGRWRSWAGHTTRFGLGIGAWEAFDMPGEIGCGKNCVYEWSSTVKLIQVMDFDMNFRIIVFEVCFMIEEYTCRLEAYRALRQYR